MFGSSNRCGVGMRGAANCAWLVNLSALCHKIEELLSADWALSQLDGLPHGDVELLRNVVMADSFATTPDAKKANQFPATGRYDRNLVLSAVLASGT